jgi:hypothetical protein
LVDAGIVLGPEPLSSYSARSHCPISRNHGLGPGCRDVRDWPDLRGPCWPLPTNAARGVLSRALDGRARSLLLVFHPARVPNTFPRVSDIDGSPAAILKELSDERTLSPWRDKLPSATSRHIPPTACRASTQVRATVPGSALLIQRRRLPVAAYESQAISKQSKPRQQPMSSSSVLYGGAKIDQP